MYTNDKVLIVDDEKINRTILKRILNDSYTVLEAENGIEAFEVLKNNIISLIILDLIMPKMDGIEFLTKKRENKEYARIPVIVATQMNSYDDEIKALTLGATDFVSKPYSPLIIKTRTKNLINLEKSYNVIDTIKIDNYSHLYTKEYFYELVGQALLSNNSYDFGLVSIKGFQSISSYSSRNYYLVLLKTVAMKLCELIKPYGIVGSIRDGICAYLVSHDSINEKMLKALNEEINSSLNGYKLQLQAGVYVNIDNNLSIPIIIDKAKFALTEITSKATECYNIFDEEANKRYINNQIIEQTMQHALENDEFAIYLQPKFNIETNEISGAEALVRWILPDGNIRYPNEFIPLFEKNGFITSLDEYVWEMVIKLIKKFSEKGINLPISVNISRLDFFSIDVYSIITKLVEKYQIEKNLLHLEITESAYSSDLDLIVNTVAKLRSYGFIIEMDDFGTGYSNLSALSILPIDIIKLDMRFVDGRFDEKKEIVSWSINLAKILHLGVICEGVETEDVKNKLYEAGCKYVQGYLYSKPISIKEFINKYFGGISYEHN